MKNLTIIKNVLIVLLALPTFVGCSDGSSSSGSNSNTSIYQCYSSSHMTVSNSYCSDINNYYCLSGDNQVDNSNCYNGNSIYQCYTADHMAVNNSNCSDHNNYYCLSGDNQVDNSACYNNTLTTNNTNQCVGTYYYSGGWVGSQFVAAGNYSCIANSAGGNNCSGVSMTSLNQYDYGQQVYCQ